MYHGSNPTALQSQQWLIVALEELLVEETYSKITIHQIYKRADLSRQTFYNFFHDKEELLRFCLRQKYEPLFLETTKKETITIQEILKIFLTLIASNHNLIHSLIRDNMEWLLTDEISKCVDLFANRFVSKELQDDLFPYSEALLSGALSHLVVLWSKQGKVVPIETLEILLSNFFSGDLYHL